LEDMMRAVLEIRRRQVTEVINQLRYQMDEAVKTGEPRSKDYEEGIAKCSRSLRNLHEAKEKFMIAR
jgi:hypothetical protein